MESIFNIEIKSTLFQQGHESALSFFYHQLYPSLVHYSHQVTQNRSLAEEIASAAFVKAWKMHDKLNSYAGIKAYLYKIVHRDSIKAVSAERKKMSNYRQGISRADEINPFDWLVRSETYRLVHEALKHLPPASRRVMIMHYIEGKSTGQIARELKLHVSTIKTQKKHGLAALRKVFGRPTLWIICTAFIFTGAGLGFLAVLSF